jgi:hypothetical protein
VTSREDILQAMDDGRQTKRLYVEYTKKRRKEYGEAGSTPRWFQSLDNS